MPQPRQTVESVDVDREITKLHPSKVDRDSSRPPGQPESKLPTGGKTLLEALRGRYGGVASSCPRDSGNIDSDATAFGRNLRHGPVPSVPEGYGSTSEINEAIGDADDETLFRCVAYLYSLGIVETDENGRMVPLMEKRIEEDVSKGGSRAGRKCAELAGEEFDIASRAIVTLVDRAMKRENGVSEVLEKTPAPLHEVVYDRLSIALFEDSESVTPRYANKIIHQMPDSNKWAFFRCLLPYVLVNRPYQERVRLVLNESDDQIVRAGLSKILSEIKSRDWPGDSGRPNGN